MLETIVHLKYVEKPLSSSICQMGSPSVLKMFLCVPKLAKNLLLINQLIEQIFKVEFEATKYWLAFFDSNKVIIEVV
jgi:hypothetical protein